MSKLYTNSIALKKETYDRLKAFQNERGVKSMDYIADDLLNVYSKWGSVSKDTYDILLQYKDHNGQTIEGVIYSVLNKLRNQEDEINHLKKENAELYELLPPQKKK